MSCPPTCLRSQQNTGFAVSAIVTITCRARIFAEADRRNGSMAVEETAKISSILKSQRVAYFRNAETTMQQGAQRLERCALVEHGTG